MLFKIDKHFCVESVCCLERTLGQGVSSNVSMCLYTHFHLHINEHNQPSKLIFDCFYYLKQ